MITRTGWEHIWNLQQQPIPKHGHILCSVPRQTIRQYIANIIVENMLMEVDLDGYSLTLMEGIINY